jgi:hypothetical protein
MHEEPSVKKGRHRRYEEARKFQRDLASSFDIESFDLDEPDRWGLPDTTAQTADDDQYAELAAKYAEDADWGDEEETESAQS